MKKLLAVAIAMMFATVTTGSFAAAHTGAQPAKDGKKDEMKKDSKKDDKKKDDKKKDEKAK